MQFPIGTYARIKLNVTIRELSYMEPAPFAGKIVKVVEYPHDYPELVGVDFGFEAPMLWRLNDILPKGTGRRIYRSALIPFESDEI